MGIELSAATKVTLSPYMGLKLTLESGFENRAWLGRSQIGEASVVETYVSETIWRGQRQATVIGA